MTISVVYLCVCGYAYVSTYMYMIIQYILWLFNFDYVYITLIIYASSYFKLLLSSRLISRCFLCFSFRDLCRTLLFCVSTFRKNTKHFEGNVTRRPIYIFPCIYALYITSGLYKIHLNTVKFVYIIFEIFRFVCNNHILKNDLYDDNC